MLQYKFNKPDEIIKFITNTPEFAEWEILVCRFSTSNGLNLDMNTRAIDTSGNTSYVKLKFLMPTINNFYETVVANNYSDLNIEIKLSLPPALKKSFDSNDEYTGFYINAYSDNITTIASSSHMERSRESGLGPVSSWDTYYAQLYQTWYNKYEQGEIR